MYNRGDIGDADEDVVALARAATQSMQERVIALACVCTTPIQIRT
jgi:hypothetical protein